MYKIVKTLRATVLLSLPVVAVACVSAANPVPASSTANVESELMAADRAYESYNQKYSYESASEEFIDFDKGFMMESGRGFLRGKTDIMAERKIDTVPSPVHWQPIGSMGAQSADMGVTWGTFSVDGDPLATGSYVTVWRKVAGEWKIVTDTVVDDSPTD